MNLKIHLLLQIILIATACLLVTGGYVLFQVNREVIQQTAATAETVGRYLEVQLSGINPNVQQPGRFPDFDLWKQTYPVSGVCLRYAPSNPGTSPRTICQGEAMPIKLWPKAFETIYRSFFSTSVEITRPITFKGAEFGSITVVPSANMELVKAWDRIKGLLGLTASTTLAVCAWVYLAIHRALRPVQIFVNRLEQMQSNDSPVNLPEFNLFEWQRIGSAINHYAATQKQLLSDRKKLVLQLMSVQEEERAFLARELHDELGQCLTGISALSASIVQTAKQSCPQIVAEVESIARINRRVMENVRSLLTRLRPTELEELGLDTSLHTMIEEWNRQHQDRIVCRLNIHGDSQSLKPPLPIVLFRIVQEGLTNIAKHSNATNAIVNLDIAELSTFLTIEDNGNLDVFIFTKTKGLGLLGVRERVTGLGGNFELSKSPFGGLRVQVNLPAAANESLKT
ncbi:MAG: sensor histidine kinase [Methylococcaceae bacterium]|nr:sensor histidine kinase [Methylococcaceae bacterium]